MVAEEDGARLLHSASERIAESLDKPSACDEWTVGEVVTHLIWAAEDDYGVAISRGLQRISTKPEGSKPSGLANPAETG